MPQRKVLIIIADQFRADCITGALAAHVDLPNITAFRREAVTFTKHFSVTNPCGPSRASMFTGQYAMNHRSVRNGAPLASGIPNIAMEARKSGYDPMLFGYTDTTMDPRNFHPNDPQLKGEERLLPGFREVIEMRMMESYPWRVDLLSKGYDAPKGKDIWRAISPDPSRAARPDDPPIYSADDSDTAFLAGEVIKNLAVYADQPWFALATFLRPHPPLVAPEPYNKMYNPAALPSPNRMENRADETAVHPFMHAAINVPKMQNIVQGCGKLSPEDDNDVQLLRALYLGLASEVDHHFGRIIQSLKDTGQYDDTLIVFMSDHGEMLGDHHMWGKQNIYDPAYRVPLIIRDPQNVTQHGKVVDALTESVDIAPTILDLIGQYVPASMNGASLRSFLEGNTPTNWRDHVHLELDFGEPDDLTEWQKPCGTSLNESNLAILREERFKLVHFNGGLAPLLFDLETDPFEMDNLAEDPIHAATLLRLTRKLLSHRMKHADETISNVKITSQGAVNFTP